MFSTRYPARVAAGLAVALALVVVAGCAAPEDESGTPTRAAPTSPAGYANAMPSADATVQLDAATKGHCDAIWAFGVFTYTAVTTTDKSQAEHDRLHQGIIKYEPEASAQVPELANQIHRLATLAHTVMNQQDATSVPAALAADNKAIVDYLTNTCKYKPT
jgi:hypothetical protein